MTGIQRPLLLREIPSMRVTTASWRSEGCEIGVVPTMGALHEGHLALVRRAQAQCDRVVVTIFVNPTQFGPKEDFAAYPRDEEKDLRLLAELGADAVWAPSPGIMYPSGFGTAIRVSGITEVLCGPFRPGHFEGVATVVCKLLNQVQADRAYFGEKDWQQLQVIRRMAADLDLTVAIEGVPTVREADGLAMSSRNAYLSPEQRAMAGHLPRIMAELARRIAARADGPFDEDVAGAARQLRDVGFDKVDYLTLSDAETLAAVAALHRPARLFAAVRIGGTRLIDNIPIPATGP